MWFQMVSDNFMVVADDSMVVSDGFMVVSDGLRWFLMVPHCFRLL